MLVWLQNNGNIEGKAASNGCSYQLTTFTFGSQVLQLLCLQSASSKLFPSQTLILNSPESIQSNCMFNLTFEFNLLLFFSNCLRDSTISWLSYFCHIFRFKLKLWDISAEAYPCLCFVCVCIIWARQASS